MEERVTEPERLKSSEVEQEEWVLIDSGAVVELTKGSPRGRWVDNPPCPYVSTRT